MSRLLLALACFAFVPSAAIADDGPAPEVPELAILSRFVGEFDLESTGGSLGLSGGESKGVWILGGRFVELNGKMTSADGVTSIEVKTIYTYDTQAGIYRSWTFTANGIGIERNGTFDETTQTLVLESTTPFASRAVSDFSDPDMTRFSIITIAGDGTETVINEGNSRRRE